jgi:MoaA/NifB/PqqE/SkfB family radical SAM enzyme
MDIKIIRPMIVSHILLTTRCNCACPQCFEKDIDNNIRDMTPESLEYILEILFKFKIDFCYQKMQFDFSGGEPLMNFDTLNAVYPRIYNKNKYVDMNSTITTNLTILPNYFVEFYHTVKPVLNVSLNSFYFSKPYKNNKSSTPDVLKNLEILSHENIFPSINTTIMADDKNIDELNDFAEYVAENKFKWNLGFEFDFKGDFSNSLQKIKKCITVLEKNHYDIQNHFRFNRITNFPKGLSFSVTSTKDIYPYFPMIGEKPIGYIDNFYDAINSYYEYKNDIFYYSDTWEKCKNCPIRENCCNYTIRPNPVNDINCELSKDITTYLKVIQKEKIFNVR